MTNYLRVLAVSFGVSLSIVFTLIFNMAVLNGGETLVKVNKYGEMIPELLLLHFVVWPIMSVALARATDSPNA